VFKSSAGVVGREPCLPGWEGAELPPRIAETDECAQRACLRMADVTVMHSVVIRATGSIATDIGIGRTLCERSGGKKSEGLCHIF
jgi:hypothetical protein